MVQNIKEHKQTNLQLLIFWENDKVPTKVGVSLSLVTVKSLVQCYASGGRFDQSNERWRTRGLEISSGRRRLRHHQSPLNWQFTSGSTSYLMENGHCEDKSDPESLRMERTEKDHTFIWRKRVRTDNWKCVK